MSVKRGSRFELIEFTNLKPNKVQWTNLHFSQSWVKYGQTWLNLGLDQKLIQIDDSSIQLGKIGLITLDYETLGIDFYKSLISWAADRMKFG